MNLKFIFWYLGMILLSFSCSKDYPVNREDEGIFIMDFNNYLGNSENIHPKVLFFENGWNGYEFWMAYTPYPKGATDAENPCIAVSHDGINWMVPSGLTNPLAPTPNDGYNSDTHLVYDEELDHLEIWWRPFHNPTEKDAVCRRVSSDGIHWSEKEVILDFGELKGLILSPAVWIYNNEYHILYSDGKELKLINAEKGNKKFKWSEPQVLPVDWGDLKAWHQDLVIDEYGNWDILVCAYGPGGNNNAADLYHIKYYPSLNQATAPKIVLHRGFLGSGIDDRSIYRSSLVKVGDGYYLYYSSIDHSWSRHMVLIKNFPIAT